jgi:outer membrane protein assembly factor BamB
MKTTPLKYASRSLLSKVERQPRALLTALFLLTQSVMAQTTFHGNNARTGAYDSVGPKVFNSVQWSFKTEGPIISSPAIANGTVFIGSSGGGFYAIDQNTGHQRWKVMLTDPISSSPAIANGIVYFISYDGVFYALAADTGDIKWRFATGGERRFEAKGIHGLTPSNQNIADPMDLFLSSPAVVDHRVYFGSSDGHIYALAAETGLLLWSFETGDIVHASPSVANNTVYIGSWDSYLYALDAETGREKWRFKSGEDPVYHNQVGFQSSPAVSNGVVYVGCRDGHVYAIDANTGKKNWDYSTSQSWVNGTPAVRDGVVYVGTSDTFRFHALDAKTGRLIFAFNAHALIFGSAAIAGDLAYFGAFNGRLYAVDASSGKLVWEFRTDSSRKDSSKMLSADGAFDRTTMTPMFHNFLDMTLNLSRMFSVGAILSSPVVDHGTIYFGSTDGSLYAVH